MHKQLALLGIGVCLLALSGATVAQPAAQPGEYVTVLINQLRSVLNADNVLGKPLELEGMRIVPIVSLWFGVGSGSGASERPERGPDTGTGGGGGGLVMPHSLLVIQGGQVNVVDARKGALSEVVQGLAPVLLEALRMRRSAEPPAPPPAGR